VLLESSSYRDSEPIDMTQPGADRISCRQEDFLKPDPPIRGQSYALISFISPEEVVRSREVFEFGEFVKRIGQDVDILFGMIEHKFGESTDVKETLDMLRERYTYLKDGQEMQKQLELFKSKCGDDLQSRFREQHGFQTNIRGFKIRGVHDSVEEARMHAKQISGADPNFNVFVSQVGCWCPWSPNPDDIADCEYAETELNTLMRKYQENKAISKHNYDKRKDAKVQAARDRVQQREREDRENLAPNMSGAFLEPTTCESDVEPGGGDQEGDGGGVSSLAEGLDKSVNVSP